MYHLMYPTFVILFEIVNFLFKRALMWNTFEFLFCDCIKIWTFGVKQQSLTIKFQLSVLVEYRADITIVLNIAEKLLAGR